MSMKPEFFCCIGAELKDEIAGSLKSSRIFMYRAAESQTIADMLVDGFFNEADDLRLNDLILLYCPEQSRAITYAKVSSVSGGVVKTSSVNISPEDIPIDTTGYSNISGSNLQQIINSIDAEFNKYLKLDGSSTMTGVLKMRASVSFECAIAPYWHGVGFYKLNDNDSVTLLASMEATDGFEPGTNNTYNIGSTSKKWKNLYLAGKAYMSVINNGFDIAIPVTNNADTLALKSQVDLAANSGSQLYATGVWYAKMYSASTVPTGAEYDGRNYADFSQVDNDNNPIIVIYEGQSGAWVEIDRVTPPATYNGYVTITSKIWDIAEQTDQQGGEVLWSYNQKTFTPYPKIVNLLNQANTDLSNLTSTGNNISNWSSNVSNCIIEIPQDINLKLNNGTLTLKAGSKVYVPNGSGVFDEVVITNDITPQPFLADDDVYAVYVGTSQQLFVKKLSGFVSGNTTPQAINDGIWYNTTAHRIEWYNGSAWSGNGGRSFPIAIVTKTGGIISSIDQVFNGFGYIGSTVFALPGVKALCSNRRNVDGTLNNNIVTITSVQTINVISADNKCIGLSASGQLRVYNGYYESETQPSTNWSYWYRPSENLFYNTQLGTPTLDAATLAVLITVDYNLKITVFTPKTAFRAVDYSDYINSDSQNVKIVGDQTVAGQKTFSSSPIVPTPITNDNTTKVATTAFVKNYAMGAPDWANQVQIYNSTTITENGYVYAFESGGDMSLILYINGNPVGGASTSHSGATRSGLCAVGIGDVVTVGGSGPTMYFVPIKYK